ncbi:MAG: DUF1648 domain-containing protein [Clostridiales bacterium]|nr:DUF1648 domain-containing protein [Clostridiales bacterium]
MRIPKRRYDIVVEILCILCLLGTFLYLIITWNNIPDEIPGHYNAVGQVDRLTKKSSIFAVPIVNLIMYIGMSAVERFPQVWNTGVRITEENRSRVYRIIKDMVKTIKLLVVIVFSYLTINSAIATQLSPWFSPVFLILMFGSLIYFIVKLIINK